MKHVHAESANSQDVMALAKGAGLHEKGNWHFHAKIDRYANDEDFKAGKVYKTTQFEKNILVNAGINLMLTLLAGGAGTAYNNANSYIGVGDSSTAEAASQTDLQAATNKLRKAMDGGYPTYGTSQQIVFRSTFASGDANYAWNEFAVFNASSGGTMLNRKVSSQGTKTSGQTWQVTITITVS